MKPHVDKPVENYERERKPMLSRPIIPRAGKPTVSVTSGKTEISGGTFSSDVVKTNGEDATLQDYVSDDSAISDSNGKFTVGKADNGHAPPAVPATKSPVKQEYEVVEGKDQTMALNSVEPLTFVVNARGTACSEQSCQDSHQESRTV